MNVLAAVRAKVLVAILGSAFLPLTVDDGKGGTNADKLDITVGIPPEGEILTPSGSALYEAGDVISFRDAATDEGSDLPASAFHWKIDFHHNTHVHPFQEFDEVTGGTFEIPTVGETSNDVWYRVYLTVTDQSGLVDKSYDIVVKIESDSDEKFTSAISQIRKSGGILNTDTIIGSKNLMYN